MQSSQCIPLTPRTLSESSSSFAVVSAAATSMDCGFPGSPRNGSLVGSGIRYQAQEEVAYQCSPGFVLFGPTKRQCLSNGTWSGAIPECRNFSYFHFAAVQCIIWLINFSFFSGMVNFCSTQIYKVGKCTTFLPTLDFYVFIQSLTMVR